MLPARPASASALAAVVSVLLLTAATLLGLVSAPASPAAASTAKPASVAARATSGQSAASTLVSHINARRWQAATSVGTTSVVARMKSLRTSGWVFGKVTSCRNAMSAQVVCASSRKKGSTTYGVQLTVQKLGSSWKAVRVS